MIPASPLVMEAVKEKETTIIMMTTTVRQGNRGRGVRVGRKWVGEVMSGRVGAMAVVTVVNLMQQGLVVLVMAVSSMGGHHHHHHHH